MRLEIYNIDYGATSHLFSIENSLTKAKAYFLRGEHRTGLPSLVAFGLFQAIVNGEIMINVATTPNQLVELRIVPEGKGDPLCARGTVLAGRFRAENPSGGRK